MCTPFLYLGKGFTLVLKFVMWFWNNQSCIRKCEEWDVRLHMLAYEPVFHALVRWTYHAEMWFLLHGAPLNYAFYTGHK